ncbi:SGNH/GDSL hydrolase family protein [Nocardioides eburneiflavus]|uniref:SGNH/GDSL hydrolase family protein n=1 Tax=Nocardioides eburneiflavus TaxID=2518372 RepID=UPI001FE7016A|nr:SGNH/GDSL hydrolase family protein [Nocardioides eburneiflavus]
MASKHLTRAGVALAVLGIVAGGTAYGAHELLHRQAAQARRRIGKPLGEDPPPADRHWKKKYGAPVDLLLLGDSVAAGLGAEKPKHTLGGRLARGIAVGAERSVRLRTAAVVGSESSVLAAQLASLPPAYRPDVAVIVVGGNDVTHRVPVAESVRHLAEAIDHLRARGRRWWSARAPTSVRCARCRSPCVPWGRGRPASSRTPSVRSRWSAGRAWSRSGRGRAVLHHQPDEMFSLDRFHPSAHGYKRTAKAMLPSVLAALGVVEEVPFGHHAPGSAGQARVPGCAPLLDEPARPSRRRPARPAGCRHPRGPRSSSLPPIPGPSVAGACSRAT